MTRSVIAGARVFDGTGADIRAADIAIEDGKIAEVGVGLVGDERIDGADTAVIPGLFDCHVHVMFSSIDVWRLAQQPLSYRYFEAARNLTATLAGGITTVREAGGADLGLKQAVEDGLIAGPRMRIAIGMIEPDRRSRRLPDALGGANRPASRRPRHTEHRRRRGRRDPTSGTTAPARRRGSHQGRRLRWCPLPPRRPTPCQLPRL